MRYNKAEIKKLYESIEEHLTEEEQEIVKKIVYNYNRLFLYAKEKKEYIERRKKQYAIESDENDKLRVRNKQLEDNIYDLKIRIKSLVNENKELTKKKKLNKE